MISGVPWALIASSMARMTKSDVSGGTNSVAQEIGPDSQKLKIRANFLFLEKAFARNILDVFVLLANQLHKLGIRQLIKLISSFF